MSRFFLLLATVSVLLLTFMVSPPSALAQSPQEKGLAIAREADRRDEGYGDMVSKLVMTLKNRSGRKSVRHMRLKSLEMKGDGDKTLSIFNRPRDIKGTALLTFSHATKPDDQWMYLPALKRVKRISSRNKSGPFMGSEFAFEDLGSQEVEKYRYRWLKDEKYKGMNCFVVERRPNYKYSGYTRQVAWIDKAEYRLQKVDYYDRKNARLKTQTFSRYHKHIKRYWRASRMNIVNHQTGKSTLLTWKKIRFRTGLTSRDFNRNSLKRAK